MQKLVELYKQWSGVEPQEVTRLAGAGSNREYYRMTDSQGMDSRPDVSSVFSLEANAVALVEIENI